MIDRIKKLLETEQLSPSQFADEIKTSEVFFVHMFFSGRNKPSLDFVMKIKQRFANVSLDWLIFWLLVICFLERIISLVE